MSTPHRKNPKIALVHDFLTYFGGAERVLMALHNLYPKAPIYTLLYDKEKMQKYFPKAKIKTSFLNSFPKFIRAGKKYLLPFYPAAAETFDFRDFDIVISGSSSFSKGIITKPKTVHICYCHAPSRFLWDWHFNYLEENQIRGIKKMLLLPLLHYLRMWDKSAADRVDCFIANSNYTRDRIKKFYGRESKVIYPPADINRSFPIFKLSTPPAPLIKGVNTKVPLIRGVGGLGGWDKEKCGIKLKNYFLIVSRLSAYKKIDIAIEAFNKLGFPLIILGEGEDKKRLEKLAEKNIIFLGFQPQEILTKLYENCQALIFPGEDDFGLTIVEAMSFGKPVLAYRKGGALETVIEGETGEFFDDPIPEILADGVRRLKNNFKNYNPEKIKARAEKFSKERFENEIRNFVENIY